MHFDYRLRTCFLIGLLGGCLATLGCRYQPAAESPEILAYRTQFLLSEAPQGAISVSEAKELMAPPEETANTAEAHAAGQAAGESSEETPLSNETEKSDKGNTLAERALVIIGRIGGVPDPWEKGQAVFIITDADAHDHAEHDHAHGEHGHEDHDHHAHNHDHDHHAHDHAGHDHADGDHSHCAFCAKDRKVAIVKLANSDGNALPIDARTLLQLKSGQTVVVRGVASLDGLGNVVLNADGVHIASN